jgi:hypothetical protein
MAMQTDVRAGHIHQSGFIVLQNRSRIKSVSIKGTATAGQFDLFSSTTAAVTGTYAQSGATITVTKSSHGLVTGDIIGIAFTIGTGGAGFSGTYAITKLTDNTFTITSPNAATITGGPACAYVVNGEWLMTFELTAADTYQNYFLLPGEGVLCKQLAYAYLNNIEVATVFYG